MSRELLSFAVVAVGLIGAWVGHSWLDYRDQTRNPRPGDIFSRGPKL